MKKLTREKLKSTFAAGGVGGSTGVGIEPTDPTDPTGPACGGSHCPSNDYICCYHQTGSYCTSRSCDVRVN